jgi:hypothetical protein
MSSDPASDPLPDALDDAATVLVHSSPAATGAPATCADLLDPPADDPEQLLWLAYASSADGALSRWRRHADARPAELGVVSVGDTARAAAAGGGGGREVDVPGAVETVGDPRDLTGVGMAVDRYLSAWASDRPTRFCLDSVTTLLQYVPFETAYRFLHVLTGRLVSHGAVGHVHVDPTAHDERTLHALATLFDARVVVDGDARRVRTDR